MNANDRYLEARVLSASPMELVRLLYGAAIQSVREARRHLAQGDIRQRSREISRAMEIAVELSGALDLERGGAVAERLAALYDYIQRRLFEANLEQQDAPLAEVLGLFETLQQAWEAVPQEPAAMPAARAPEPLDAPCPPPASGYGYGESQYAMASQSWSA